MSKDPRTAYSVLKSIEWLVTYFFVLLIILLSVSMLLDIGFTPMVRFYIGAPYVMCLVIVFIGWINIAWSLLLLGASGYFQVPKQYRTESQIDSKAPGVKKGLFLCILSLVAFTLHHFFIVPDVILSLTQ